MSEGLERVRRTLEDLRAKMIKQREEWSKTVEASKVRPMRVIRESPLRPVRSMLNERPVGSFLRRFRRREE